jgi:hypothetical protein
MNDIRAQLADLASSAGKESMRLARVERIDAREELQVRVWPFLADLVDLIESSLIDEEGPPLTIPVETVARAVQLLLFMANRLGGVLPKAEMDVIALRAAEVTEELMSLCDPDELALYVQAGTASQPNAEEAASPGTIIDTTIVEDDGHATEDEDAPVTDTEPVNS